MGRRGGKFKGPEGRGPPPKWEGEKSDRSRTFFAGRRQTRSAHLACGTICTPRVQHPVTACWLKRIEGLSRITVVVDVEELPLEQVTKQLNKLINVIKIVELDPTQSVNREHLLIKVRVDNTTRSQILEAVNLFRARVVDVASDALIIETTGDSGKIQAFLRVLEPYGIKEIAQSGLLAMGRGSKSITDRVFKN